VDCLEKYLEVLKADLRAAIAELEDADDADALHIEYESTKNAYFAFFPDPDSKKK